VGGQGNVLLSRFLARAFAQKGYQVSTGETFGGTQRGGSVMSHIRISKKRLHGALIPEGHTDFILGLEPIETVRVLGVYGNPHVAVLSNLHPTYPIDTITGEKTYPAMESLEKAIRDLSSQCWFLDATRISLDMGSPLFANMIMMGALVQTGAVDLKEADMEAIIRETFASEIAETNIHAAHKGMEALMTV
jgi:indolepyruvate ferredoxin oxidoreductase beta subunit